MLTVTITANYFFWACIPILMFLSGKLMQQGGVKYGRGENWQPETLLGLVVMFVLLMPLGFALLAQNMATIN